MLEGSRAMRASILLPMGLTVGLAACSAPPPLPDNNGGECDVVVAGPEPDLVDLLFVVDVRDVGASATAAIYDRVAALVDTLIAFGSSSVAPLWLHVGVVSADLEAGGLLVPQLDGAYLEWAPWLPTARGGTPGEQVRGALGRLPAHRGPRAPLETIRYALIGNAGFSRPDSALLVVVVTDGDDEGTADPTGAARLFTTSSTMGGLRLDPRDTWFGLVAGACGKAGVGWSAPAAPRLQGVLDTIGRGGRALLCDADFTTALPPFEEVDVEPACLSSDVHGGAESCVVYDEGGELDDAYRASIPSCDAGDPPCFRLTESSLCPSGRGVAIDRGDAHFAPRGSETHIACACGPDPG
jgi:hypothetical protein